MLSLYYLILEEMLHIYEVTKVIWISKAKLKEDQTHPVPLSVSRSYTPLLVIYYDTTV